MPYWGVYFLLTQQVFAYAPPRRHVVLRWAWAKAYLQNHFARIYPLYAISAAITPVVHFSTLNGYNGPNVRALSLSGQLLGVFLNFISLTRLFSRFIVATGVGAAWSLLVALLFYLSLPLVLFFAQRRVLAYLVGRWP